MRNGTAERVTFNQAAQAILRMLIASYFLAVALNLIPGTDLGLLFTAVLPAPVAGALAAGLVFVLACLVMMAYFTRAAALILGLMTFYASYLTMVEMGVAQELGAFWRDLALIAALLLTYSDSGPARHPRRRYLLQRAVAPRRVAPMLARVTASLPEPATDSATADTPTPRAADAHAPPEQSARNRFPVGIAAALRAAPIEPEIDNMFADDSADAPFRSIPTRGRHA